MFILFYKHRVKYAKEEEDLIITSHPANVLCYFRLLGVWKHFFKKLETIWFMFYYVKERLASSHVDFF